MASKTSSSFYKWDRRSDRFPIFTATRKSSMSPSSCPRHTCPLFPNDNFLLAR